MNVCIVGDPMSGKKTFIDQIMSKQRNEKESQTQPTYHTVDIEGEKNLNFNFFVAPSTLKGLSKTVSRIVICDILVLFFNLVEDENSYFQQNQDASQTPKKLT